MGQLQNLLLQALPNILQGAKAKMKATCVCSVCVWSLVVMTVSSTPLTPKERFLGQLLGVQWGPNHSTSQPSPTITGADTVPVKPLTSDNDDHNHDHDTTCGDCHQVWG